MNNMRKKDRIYQVLVVDDNATNRLKMSMAAKNLGHATTMAEDGLVALNHMNEGNFDLILLDIEMPNLDGFGVLSAMRKEPRLRDIPVVVISAVDDMTNIVKAVELGAQDFLPKNFERVLFTARVGACLETKRLTDQRSDYLAEIEFEKKRVDDLLSATLPAAAIEELKRTNRVKPRRFEGVVVLMADVVNFTSFCDAHPPEEAVSRLENLVDGFEEITKINGLEKIKTIGDAYMATAGLLKPNDMPILTAAKSALEMASSAPILAKGWEIRVGIHIGPVVAGVIGKQQHLFDLWGDTVNTAARLSGLALPGSVCVSKQVWEGISGRGKSLGHLQAKGKGTLEAFQLDGLD